MNRVTVAENFARREAGRTKNLFTSSDGSRIYSYGDHWVIAAWDGDAVLVNEERVSVTTSCQTTAVKNALAARGFSPSEETRDVDGPVRGMGRGAQRFRFRVWTRSA